MTAAPVGFTDEEIAGLCFDENGLVAAIVQDADHRDVLMLGWMDAEAVRRTLTSGRTWFWSRSRQEYWCKGETSGDRQHVRAAAYDCDGDALLDHRRPGGPRRLPHRGVDLLPPPVRRVADVIRTDSGKRSRPSPAAAPSGGAEIRSDLERFCGLARDYTVVPVWRELVADTLTPVGAFRAMVGDGPGFLLESVEHGERWSRFSFVGRAPAATLVARGRQVEVMQGSLPASVPLTTACSRCVEALLERYRSPSLEELPPLHGGLVGYLGYDVVREIERLGGAAARRPRPSPTRWSRSSASSPPSTTGASASRSSTTSLLDTDGR